LECSTKLFLLSIPGKIKHTNVKRGFKKSNIIKIKLPLTRHCHEAMSVKTINNDFQDFQPIHKPQSKIIIKAKGLDFQEFLWGCLIKLLIVFLLLIFRSFIGTCTSDSSGMMTDSTLRTKDRRK
jgi:hypothetical protein